MAHGRAVVADVAVAVGLISVPGGDADVAARSDAARHAGRHRDPGPARRGAGRSRTRTAGVRRPARTSRRGSRRRSSGLRSACPQTRRWVRGRPGCRARGGRVARRRIEERQRLRRGERERGPRRPRRVEDGPLPAERAQLLSSCRSPSAPRLGRARETRSPTPAHRSSGSQISSRAATTDRPHEAAPGRFFGLSREVVPIAARLPTRPLSRRAGFSPGSRGTPCAASRSRTARRP